MQDLEMGLASSQTIIIASAETLVAHHENFWKMPRALQLLHDALSTGFLRMLLYIARSAAHALEYESLRKRLLADASVRRCSAGYLRYTEVVESQLKLGRIKRKFEFRSKIDVEEPGKTGAFMKKTARLHSTRNLNEQNGASKYG